MKFSPAKEQQELFDKIKNRLDEEQRFQEAKRILMTEGTERLKKYFLNEHK